MFILKKKIDWSLLTAGLTIPVEFQLIIQQLKGGVVEKGMTHTIKILIDQDVFEAHHIEYFTKSLNNDTSNIIIVNPSFHRIIHQASDLQNGRRRRL